MKSLYRIAITCLLIAVTNLTGQEVPLVEPPFWWTGFKNTELQIMVYAKDISQHTPVIKYNNLSIKKTHSIENPNYLFIDLELNANTKPGTFNIDFVDNKKKTIYTYQYQLKEREKNSSDRMGFNSTDAIYLITPDRFANGDLSNDTHANMKDTTGRSNWSGRHGGDIQGIIDNLDYIDKMGFTAIWINPLIENDMHRDSYHGYASTNFYKTDPRYGTNEDYLLLCDKARERGMKVISDMIFNHCGSEHYWMKDLPSKDWFNNGGEYGQCNHRRTVYNDPYASAIDKKAMTEGWFVREMPDLNQENPFVAKYLTQNSIWWIEYAGIDGIRVDTQPYPYKEFMAEWSKA
ncbi:MAG: alpha-amylase family glycosyl hydrolase, partial [Bacteroidales bacterium]|nr:alpha-amylase family glycosyl hydrolase [Bacteroidales bacterium]